MPEPSDAADAGPRVPQMDTPPERDIPTLTPWIALVAVGASLLVIALAPGLPKLPMFAVGIALNGAGMFGIARIAAGGLEPAAEPSVFARALRTWIIIFAVGVALFAVGLVVLDETAVLAAAGIALVLAGALGALATALRHRRRT
ncbi:MAG: hypothetical protein JWL76_459 [Thermoleophilia bacterium]|nr:hypothetical protein [Thermoleophilia bacterium]